MKEVVKQAEALDNYLIFYRLLEKLQPLVEQEHAEFTDEWNECRKMLKSALQSKLRIEIGGGTGTRHVSSWVNGKPLGNFSVIEEDEELFDEVFILIGEMFARGKAAQ